jgi:hypothetical protein
MTNNLTSLTGGFGTGVIQDSTLYVRPYDTLIVAPQSNATSTLVPASTITQQTIPVWVANTQGLPVYIKVDQPLIWALTFQGTTTYLGQRIVSFDCLRNAILTFNTATTVATTVTISGYDDVGTPVVWTSGSVVTGSTSVISTKCFKLISYVSFTTPPWSTGASTNTVLLRGGTFIGLPNFINTTNSVISAMWGTTSAMSVIVPGAIWRQTSITPPINASTSIPTATSSDARGYIDITGLGSAANGAILLQVVYYVYGEDQVINNQLKFISSTNLPRSSVYNYANQPGSSAAVVRIKSAQSGNPMLNSLVKQDRFGAQFPGDSDFMQYYNNLYTKV